MGFCSHQWRGERWFDPFYGSLDDPGERRALRQWKLAHGQTGMITAQRYGYRPISDQPRHLRNRPEGMPMSEWVSLVEEMASDGLFPLVVLAGDLPASVVLADDAKILRDACRAFRHLSKQLYAEVEWESSRTGMGYTTRQNDTALLVMREEFGDDALLVLHTRPADQDAADGRVTGASYPVEADDPVRGDEIGWWYSDAGQECDILGWQSRHGALGPSYCDDIYRGVDGEGKPIHTWLAKLIESAERFLPDGTINYYGHPVRTELILGESETSPDWFAGNKRRRGRPILCGLETVPVEYSRSEIDDARVAAVQALVARTGVTSWGCMGAQP